MQHPPQLAHRNPKDDHGPNPESGIVLLMVVFLTFLMLLALAIAAPEWAKSMQRQKEIETIHRGQQYERAIQLYYRQFHRYPNTIKELLHTNNVRFLRKQYKDPLTGKDDWKLVLYGHAHVHPLGPFGKPLSDLGAIQSSGGMYAVSGSSSSGGSAPTAAASASDSMGFGSSMSSGFGSSMSSGIGSPMGGSSLDSSPTTSTTDTTKSSSTSALGSPTSSNDGFQTNAPFVGVVPPIKGKSIVDYRAQGNYDRWEFNYDPIVDELKDKVSILGGSQSDLNGATSINSSDNSKKSSSSNSLFGGNNLLGGSNSSSGSSSNSSSSANSSTSGNSNNSDSGNPQ